jgi:hypothetical protein
MATEKDEKKQQARLSVSDDATLVERVPSTYGTDKHGQEVETSRHLPEIYRAGLKPSRFSHDPHADTSDNELQYNTMAWWKVSALMLAETVSCARLVRIVTISLTGSGRLGILSIPSVFAAVGMAAGIILVAGLGGLATYTGYNMCAVPL